MKKYYKNWILLILIVITGQSVIAIAAPDPLKDPKYCGSCHQRIYKEWSGSLMGKDLNNSIVYQFYTGTNPAGKKDGLGFQPLMHGKNGDCADCHVPELALEKHAKGEEVDLGIAMKQKLDHGISCNFCHSIADVHINKDKNGRYNTRIFETVTMDHSGVKYGPRADAKSLAHPTMKSDLIRDSKLCGTCHLNQEKFLSISQYDDWKKAYTSGKTNQTCQQCHMPILPGRHKLATVTGLNNPKRITRAHTFVGAHDTEMLKKALTLEVKPEVKNGKLIVNTTVENVGAGHKVPGSGPIRNVILKIEVTDVDGKILNYIGDKRGLLPPLAGFGNPKTKKRGPNDWAGKPGKMYAKVYKSKPIAKMGNRSMVGVGGFLADAVVFDTALKPREPDHAKFVYALPKNTKSIKIKARIVYRDAFKPLSDKKGWKLAQREMITVNKIFNLKE
ncbi:multiheme c-type cytochrome [Bathymodiolus septemdierum thioautotrophic gill symbiont]|uniref:Cytochrome c-552/4 domain-containing protein n=1 Tax=endosymbiont of Bathymodiolus septemdierum str. Myojin knoll TaxID=1303921 RepID=A0A0P0UT62_9GAMM|nr:multiheme c-type cytochrome [Bathymodiolus septemdierum thioautotrophic gill symbiont]BAS68358.1 hypothetical protein BSEPE_1377 [endosymbiont of Bathymodiolus septemdierum str. Myojin knoll]